MPKHSVILFFSKKQFSYNYTDNGEIRVLEEGTPWILFEMKGKLDRILLKNECYLYDLKRRRFETSRIIEGFVTEHAKNGIKIKKGIW